MTPIRDHQAVASNVLRYLDVLASEWRTMRTWLATRDPRMSQGTFGNSTRRRVLAVPSPAASALLQIPAVLSTATLLRHRDELAEILPRLRLVDRPLADASLVPRSESL